MSQHVSTRPFVIVTKHKVILWKISFDVSHQLLFKLFIFFIGNTIRKHEVLTFGCEFEVRETSLFTILSIIKATYIEKFQTIPTKHLMSFWGFNYFFFIKIKFEKYLICFKWWVLAQKNKYSVNKILMRAFKRSNSNNLMSSLNNLFVLLM